MDEEEQEKSKPKLMGSEDYVDALQSIQADAWDFDSWNLLIEEVEGDRGGSASIRETYDKFLAQFPSSSKILFNLASYYAKEKNYAEAAEVLERSIAKLRNVELWEKYLDVLEKKNQSSTGKKQSQDEIGDTRRTMEEAFEKAIDNVGMSVESGQLWKRYVDFVKDWPDASGMDPEKKRSTLRKIYQTSLSVPMEKLQVMWEEYDKYENAQDSHEAKEILPEFDKLFLSSKTLLDERKQISNRIKFDRFAVPPARSRIETDQLDCWNKWIKYELENKSNLEPDQLKKIVEMVYEQCLCCFRYNAEVWLSYAKYKNDHKLGGGDEARVVYKQGLEAIPGSILLRIAFAEAEEVQGNIESASQVYRDAFDQLPCGFSFSVRQKFIRRQDGLVASRAFFSSTFSIRSEKKVGYEIYLANAKMELDANSAPDIAIKVLELCKASYPNESHSLEYAKLLASAHLRTGNLKQIQWTFQTILGQGGAEDVPNFSSNFKSSENNNDGAGDGNGAEVTSNYQLSLRDQLELWNEYLHCEDVLGLSNVPRMNALRTSRDKAAIALDDHERTKEVAVGSSAGGASGPSSQLRLEGLFDCPGELVDRYGVMFERLPEKDMMVYERSRAKASLSSYSHSAQNGLGGGLYGAGNTDVGGKGIPPVLKNFIGRLPKHNGPMPNIEGFLRHLKGLTLPPRPTSDDTDNIPITIVGGKRQMPGSEWLTNANGDGADTIDYEMDEDATDKRDDVFRQRRRARLK